MHKKKDLYIVELQQQVLCLKAEPKCKTPGRQVEETNSELQSCIPANETGRQQQCEGADERKNNKAEIQEL